MWVKDSNTWVTKELKLYLSSDNSTVLTGITSGNYIDTGVTFDFCADGKCVAWYDFSNILNLDVDNNNFVNKVSDQTGNNYDLIQTDVAYRPLYASNGVYFNGTDTYMINSDINKSQPTSYYLVAQYIGSSDGMFFDSMDATNRNSFGVDSGGYLMTASSSDSISVPLNNNLVIYTNIFNFDNSKFSLNNTSEDVDLSSSQSYLSGMTFGTIYSLTGYYGNFTVKEFIIRDGVDDQSIQNDIKNYLSTKYNITL